MLGKDIVGVPSFILPEEIPALNIYSYQEAFINGGFAGLSVGTPTTQKARGIFYLQNKKPYIQNTFCHWNVPKHILFRSGVSFDDGSFNFPVFARPCPVNPRHGFVDSTLCKNAEELNQVSKSAYQAEKDAELLITKPVSSHYNAIINGNTITFSYGNDGATAGRDCKYFYISEDPISSMLGLNENQVIAPEEIPFYEFVFGPATDSRPVNLVQVRSAPKTPRVKDFVPSTVEVKTILKAEGDLLKWEALLKTVDPSTTIIDHTNGSLSSHYAIHAIVNRIPIFTTYLPALGSVVQPTVEDATITDADKSSFVSSFARGFYAASKVVSLGVYQGCNFDYGMGNIIRTSLAALHNYSSIALSKDYQLLGMVLGLFCRVAFSVSCGETRYNRKRKDSSIFSSNYFAELPDLGRSNCYEYYMNLSNKSAVRNISTIYRVFEHMKWDNNYGGKKWASCTRGAINLFNACAEANIQKAVELFNIVINENHNGGKYLNKVVSGQDFDQASLNPSVYALRNLQHIVDILSVAWDHSKDISPSEIAEIKTISLDWSTDKYLPSKDNSIDSIYIAATSNSNVEEIVVVDSYGNKHFIQIPCVPNSNWDSCTCETCIPSGKFSLHSIPFWIVDSHGVKIVSKSYLFKQLKSLGIKANIT